MHVLYMGCLFSCATLFFIILEVNIYTKIFKRRVDYYIPCGKYYLSLFFSINIRRFIRVTDKNVRIHFSKLSGNIICILNIFSFGWIFFSPQTSVC